MLFKSCTRIVFAGVIIPRSIHHVNDIRWIAGGLGGRGLQLIPQFLDQFTSSIQLGLSALPLVQTLGTVDNFSFDRV